MALPAYSHGRTADRQQAGHRGLDWRGLPPVDPQQTVLPRALGGSLAALSSGHRCTRARARHGLPDPLTSLSGATMSIAPVAGSRARLASWVRPYLFAPSRKVWQGNAGLKECEAPASVPTVSTPTPR